MADNIRRYAYNLFAFPEDYFETHTADELGVTEEERSDLIAMKAECEKRKKSADPDAYERSQDRALEEFEKEFFEE